MVRNTKTEKEYLIEYFIPKRDDSVKARWFACGAYKSLKQAKATFDWLVESHPDMKWRIVESVSVTTRKVVRR